MIKIKEILNPSFGKAFSRISDALHKYSPDKIEWVNSDPDFYIVHTVGGEEYLKIYELDLNKVINVQHCVFTTGMSIESWENLWKDTFINISFHDLQSYTKFPISFYRTPWGAEKDLFYYSGEYKSRKVATTGYVANTECIDLLFQACSKTKNVLQHTGNNFKWDNRFYKFHEHMEDDDFRRFLAESQYVSGLRKMEGFEMMCIEGAMCGATPIIPDEPTYDFYKDFGIRINTKVSDNEIVNQLSELFDKQFVIMSDDIIKYVRDTFSWEVIIRNIFSSIIDRT